jgi:hypothetical protein
VPTAAAPIFRNLGKRVAAVDGWHGLTFME